MAPELIERVGVDGVLPLRHVHVGFRPEELAGKVPLPRIRHDGDDPPVGVAARKGADMVRALALRRHGLIIAVGEKSGFAAPELDELAWEPAGRDAARLFLAAAQRIGLTLPTREEAAALLGPEGEGG